MDNYLMFNGVKYNLVPVEETVTTETTDLPVTETTTVTEPTGGEATVESSVNTE